MKRQQRAVRLAIFKQLQMLYVVDRYGHLNRQMMNLQKHKQMARVLYSHPKHASARQIGSKKENARGQCVTRHTKAVF